MTDLQKYTYLKLHIGVRVHLYHILNGDLTLEIVSINYRARTFKYRCGAFTATASMDFSEVVQFDYRGSGIPESLGK